MKGNDFLFKFFQINFTSFPFEVIISYQPLTLQLYYSTTKDIEFLQQINEDLENKLDELDTSSDSEDIESLVPNSYIQDKLKSLNILIMGGHQIWQNRLKELYPYFNYIDSDNVNFDINVNNGRTENKNKVIYIGSNNFSYFRDLVINIILEK